MLHTDWTEVEVIELLVDSTTGLGFGMCGSKSTGIIVRHIHPGGAAEMDGRLRLGDHIVCVQDFNVRGFGPDQVATVLRQTISANLLAASLHPDVSEGLTTSASVSVSGGTVDQTQESLTQTGWTPNPPTPVSSIPRSIQCASGHTGVPEQTLVEAIVHAVPIRFIVARSVQGIPQELSEEYAVQQRLIQEHQVFGTVSIIPTERLDDYLEALIHSSLPVVNLQTLQPLTETNQDGYMDTVLPDDGYTKTAAPQLSVNDSNEELVSQVDSSCRVFSPTVMRPETGETNHESEHSNQSENVVPEKVTPLAVANYPCQMAGRSDSGRPFSPLLADEDDSLNGSRESPSGTTSTETITVTLHRPKEGGLGLTIVGYVYTFPDHEDQYNYGVFVQKLTPGSVAEKCGLIQVNDQIVQVNNQHLIGVDNMQAVSLLKDAGPMIALQLRRYTKGFLCDQLQKAARRLPPVYIPSPVPRKLERKIGQAFNWQPDGEPLVAQVQSEDKPRSGGRYRPIMLELTEDLDQPNGCALCRHIVATPVIELDEEEENTYKTSIIATQFAAHNNERSEYFSQNDPEQPIKPGNMISRPRPVTGMRNSPQLIRRQRRRTSKENKFKGQSEQTAHSSAKIGRLMDDNVLYAGDVTPELEESMRNVWQPLIGPDYDILVLHIRKPKNASNLGISLQGVSEVRQPILNTEAETAGADLSVVNGAAEHWRPIESRHFVHSVLPDGPIGKLNIVQPGDELLQVNGRRLRGTSHSSTVRCLRNLPNHIELILARARSDPLTGQTLAQPFELVNSQGPPLEVLASEIGSIDTAISAEPGDAAPPKNHIPLQRAASLSSDVAQKRVSDWVRRSRADLEPDPSFSPDWGLSQTDPIASATSNAARTHNGLSSNNSNTSRFARVGPETRLDYSHTLPARRHTTTVQLNRSATMRAGNGADAVSRTSTLTHRGPPVDPRYGLKRPVWSKIPLLFQLTKTSQGFGFSISEYEELTVSDSEANHHKRRSLTLGFLGSTSQKSSRVKRSATMPLGRHPNPTRKKKRPGILLVDSVMPGSVAHQDGRISVGDRLLFVNDRNLTHASLREAAAALRAAPKGPCLLGIAKMHLEPNVFESDWDAQPVLPDSAMGRALDQPLHVSTALDGTDAGQDAYWTTGFDHQTLNFHALPPVDPQISLHAPDLTVPPVDRLEERSVEIRLNGAPFGIKLDSLAVRGQDGCRVLQVLEGGAIHQTNALGVNDYVTEINEHNMRGLTNLDAFHIIREISSRSDVVSIRYFPASVVQMHRMLNLQQPNQFETSAPYPTMSAPNGHLAIDHLDAPVKSKVGHVLLERQPHERTWGLELSGQFPDALVHNTPPSSVRNPTWIASIAPNSPADRCGSLQSGDLLLQIENYDVSNIGPEEIIAQLGHYVDQGILQLHLVVSYCALPDAEQPPDCLVSEVTRTLVVADVERRHPSLSAGQLGYGTVPVNGTRRVSGARLNGPDSESSQMDTPEPLTELDSRDELNVLSRSIPSPVHENGAQTDSDGEGGRLTQDDQGPVVSVACPVIPEELIVGPRAGEASRNHMLTSVDNGESNYSPPPLPPRRFSQEYKQSLDVTDQHLHIAAGDPLTLYTRIDPPGDEIITVNLHLTDGRNVVGDGAAYPAELVTTPCKVENLGIRLVGSRIPDKIATYIGGFCPGSVAFKDNLLQVGDEIVQVDQYKVDGLSRLTVCRCLTRTTAESISRWRSNGSDPNNPPMLYLIVRRNPFNADLMVSSPTSPERGQSNLHTQFFGASTMPSRFEVNGSQSKGPDEIMSSRTASLMHQVPVAPAFVQQITAQLGESLSNLDVFNVELQREKDGFGIYIVNLGPNEERGVFVSELTKNGAAALQGGLQAHDRILAVNGIVPQDYDSTLRLLKQSELKVLLTVGRPKQQSGLKLSAPVATSSPTPDAVSIPRRKLSVHEPIQPGMKTLVELRREPNGTFGFSIVGGKDTMLGDILIHEVHADGVASRDGRLQTGDRLLAVNGVNLMNADHSDALQAIRSAGDCIRLLVYRDLTPRFVIEDDVQLITVTMTRKPGQNLGLSLVSRSPYSAGIAIGEVAKGTVAEQVGQLQPGDVLVEVNGRDVRLAQIPEVINLLKDAEGPITIKVERTPTSRRPPYPPALPDLRLTVYTVLLQRSSHPHETDLPGHGIQDGWTDPMLIAGSIDPSFGLVIRQATPEELKEGGGRLIITDIKPGSPAALSAMILYNDRLLSVDREPVDWLQPEDVSKLLAGLQVCTLEVGRLDRIAPYPIDAELRNPVVPPYPPPSQELPEMFDALMPTIESPLIRHEIDTVEEEEPMRNHNPSENQHLVNGDLANEAIPGTDVHHSDTSSATTAVVNPRESGAGFQFRQITLPLASSPPAAEPFFVPWSQTDPAVVRPSLGMQLAKGPGISGPMVVHVDPESPAALADVRRGDQILGLDDSLLLAVAANRSVQEIMVLIEDQWLSRCVGSCPDPKPLCFTVVRMSQPSGVEPETKTVEEENSFGNEVTNEPQPDHPSSEQNGEVSADVSFEQQPCSVNNDPNEPVHLDDTNTSDPTANQNELR